MLEWQRFKTTRVYLHPPKAERLITLWREGKLMLGEIEAPINQHYENISAAGVWFINGEGGQVNLENTAYELRENGIPVHKLHLSFGKLAATLECVCDYNRLPSGHVKLTVKAKDGAPVCDKFGFMLRCGKE